MTRQTTPAQILGKALLGGAGGGDSLVEVLVGFQKLLEAAATMGDGLEAGGDAYDGLLNVASERILLFGRYSGFSRNLSALLTAISDRARRMVAGRDPRPCLVSALKGYVEEAVAKAYEYCYGIGGGLLVTPRGVLAYACALGKIDAGGRGSLYVPRGGYGAPPLFRELRAGTLHWRTAYQQIENGVVEHVASQLEYASHIGYVASLGTSQLNQILAEKYGEPRLHLLGHGYSLFMGAPPGAESAPIARIEGPTGLWEEYPVLEVGRWENLGPSRIILGGEPFELKPPIIRAVLRTVTGGMLSRVEECWR